jgi:hypothetical protein
MTTTTYIALMVFSLVLVSAMSNPSSEDHVGRQDFKNYLTVEWHLIVVNELSGGKMLFLHCKSEDDDLGKHKIGVREKFSWGFRPNFWGTTHFWCYMHKDKAQATFDVFQMSLWIAQRCNCIWYDECNCIWIARDDGIYLQNIPNKRDELMLHWEIEQ